MDDVDFLRYGGRTFRIIEEAVESIDAAITHRIEDTVRNLNTAYMREANSIASAEHQRIISELHQTQIAVPPNLFGHPVAVINGAVCPIRSVVYAPNVIRGSWGSWMAHVSGELDRELSDYLAAAGLSRDDLDDDRYAATTFLTGTPTMYSAVLFAKLPNQVVVSRELYHSVSSIQSVPGTNLVWKSWCTGDSTADVYWNRPISEFANNVNLINIDSLGHGRAEFGGNQFNVLEYARTLTNRRWQVVANQEEGWTV